MTTPARATAVETASNGTFELRFCMLFREGRAFAFPCDAQGRVDIDSLTERARANYFYARTVVGREVSVPVVRPTSLH